MPPLFASHIEYEEFRRRHALAAVPRGDEDAWQGPCYLGVDAGSTTTKIALTDREGKLLWTFYSNNQGNPLKTVIQALAQLRARMPAGAWIARSCATGYGEEWMKSALRLDEGEVETIAHVTAASFFDPQVDCVLDIGGQDMKYIKLKNGAVDTILLNEACSSGCGSFLENFATSMGQTAQSFAAAALFAPNPVDLGTRCTVFMNSKVKQAQKEGASLEDISAGLAYSVIRNALFKVIKLADAADLGTHVVVQGGTFFNQAVLRAFEQISGKKAVCPDIAGVMGAFGAALIARSHDAVNATTMIPLEELPGLAWETTTTHCGGCENRCMLTINSFPDGRKHITGNRCERGLGKQERGIRGPNLVSYKLRRMFDYPVLPAGQASRGGDWYSPVCAGSASRQPMP